MSTPTFVVVGHPNKGKSSIVATLTQDESVHISPIPGATVKSRYFPMKIDGREQYILVDTPGFQRARRTFAWIKSKANTASERANAISQFIETYQNTDQFTDECELLGPIMQGAGILYVTDGSHPYGEEYEAEMEILRWTGQPSIALINMVGEGDYIEQWRAALSQYFKIVRVFNAVTAEFNKRLDLLKAFGQLQEEWQNPLNKAIKALEERRQNQTQQSALAIAQMLATMVSFKITKKISSKKEAHIYEESLTKKYKDKLRDLEKKGRSTIEGIYDYHGLVRSETELNILDIDLFSLDSWNIFGLNRQQLITTGAASGALAGLGFDAAVGGSSFLLGAAVGSVIGGVTARFSHKKIADIRTFGIPLGGIEFRIGPTTNINFPYVVLGRALYHYKVVSQRTHAQRGSLDLESQNESTNYTSLISDTQRKKLERLFTQIRRSSSENFDSETIDSLTDYIEVIMNNLEFF
ncbi:DUF3482 domain-containing protein [Candidatus Nitrosacidococcus sp. I8]|uniref:DUF3482 domain-containing protein n=1 Tax=Candidatus Nitrosacidococcus sp. I8 TaxID=2942908 RepID=UPI002226D268|nr:DUF3482 domain-containing protein [Candidatus Nitrosacidococcus sp. I8]CAH9018970.1 GTPase Der [Candidatus Nitrosacidococcus sp. I8]